MSDPVRDNHTDINHTISEHGVGGSSRREQSSNHSAEDATVRQMQVLRGALSSKMVASRAALQSLQSIDVADLPENERSRHSLFFWCFFFLNLADISKGKAVLFSLLLSRLNVKADDV